MRLELLYKIADVINTNSDKYHANIPRAKKEYMTQIDHHLVRSYCWVLHIMKMGKVGKSHVNRFEWNLYETDIDRIIKRMVKRDTDFAARINNCEPTPLDVQSIVRRASFQSLRLKLTKTSYDIYFSD